MDGAGRAVFGSICHSNIAAGRGMCRSSPLAQPGLGCTSLQKRNAAAPQVLSILDKLRADRGEEDSPEDLERKGVGSSQ